ncbi:MAG TPA: M15 family metallopeptidase [Rhizomicrobium sp.]|nr:M15 family metallopeptidase [Rhizomicrobium sp.]
MRPFWFLYACAALLLSPVLATAAEQPAGCGSGPAAAATANAASENTLLLNLFGREETGWLFYVPLIAKETGSDCPAESPGFSYALASWQSAHGLSGTGIVDVATLQKLKQVWQAKRPFVVQSAHQCPAPPDEGTLAQATKAESYGGKQIQLRAEALSAYRDMVAAARMDGVLSSDPKLLEIFSAYRSPDFDAARCAAEQNCQGVVRASCSAHRTALAMDVNLGAAPGFTPDSSADINRLFISKSPAYRWLVKNAGRFGFVNYPFEPWHWEFVGRAASR